MATIFSFDQMTGENREYGALDTNNWLVTNEARNHYNSFLLVGVFALSGNIMAGSLDKYTSKTTRRLGIFSHCLMHKSLRANHYVSYLSLLDLFPEFLKI